MKFRLSLELHVTHHKPNKPEPEPEADHQPRGDNYASTERAHPEPEGTLNQAGFSIDPY